MRIVKRIAIVCLIGWTCTWRSGGPEANELPSCRDAVYDSDDEPLCDFNGVVYATPPYGER
jgi:hypothetical protein